jgi:hypothetical protein
MLLGATIRVLLALWCGLDKAKAAHHRGRPPPDLFFDFSGWHVRARITNKTFPIGHLHARKRSLVQLRLFVNDSVQVQNERRNRIGLVGRKTPWSRIRHRAMYIIPDGCRVRPVAPHRPHRVLAAQRALASSKRGIWGYSLSANSRNGRKAMEVVHGEDQRPIHQAMDHYVVTARIDFRHSGMMHLVMQRGGRDDAEQVLQRCSAIA